MFSTEILWIRDSTRLGSFHNTKQTSRRTIGIEMPFRNMLLVIILTMQILASNAQTGTLCASSPCMNGGDCIAYINSFQCNCAAGYTGNYCQSIINECTPTACQNGATCIPLPNGYNCTCAPGWTGLWCQNMVNQCASQPCQMGTCINAVNAYSCACIAGYSGQQCQTNINECASMPCVNGGICTDLINGYRCTCRPGYSGLLCETNINECASQPCATNQATCVDLVNGFTCACLVGYSGTFCETNINECVSQPCINGTCTDLVNGYQCNCTLGWTGPTCMHADACALHPCNNGGLCINVDSGFLCNCTTDFSGPTCDSIVVSSTATNGGAISTTTTVPFDQTVPFYIMTSVIGCIVIVLLVLGIIYLVRWRRAQSSPATKHYRSQARPASRAKSKNKTKGKPEKEQVAASSLALSVWNTTDTRFGNGQEGAADDDIEAAQGGDPRLEIGTGSAGQIEGAQIQTLSGVDDTKDVPPMSPQIEDEPGFTGMVPIIPSTAKSSGPRPAVAPLVMQHPTLVLAPSVPIPHPIPALQPRGRSPSQSMVRSKLPSQPNTFASRPARSQSAARPPSRPPTRTPSPSQSKIRKSPR